jgi:hypothetical protein
MPNWVKHNVSVSGSKEKLENFKDQHFKMEDGELIFDFNTIIPMPENIFRGDLGQREKELYGKNNWYDWSLENWGTKWNSAHVFCGDIYKADKQFVLSFEFDTAWATPYEIIDKMVLMHPDLFFEIQFADEDIGSNCGYYHCEDGASLNFVDDEQFALEVWGYDDEMEEL